MYNSNQILAINGHDKKEMALAIKFALKYGECCGKEYFPVCFKIDPVFGVIFYWMAQEGTQEIPVYLQTIDCLCELATNALKEEIFKQEYHNLYEMCTCPDGSDFKGWLLYCPNTDEIVNNFGYCSDIQELQDKHRERWNGNCAWNYSSFAIKPYPIFYAK